MNNFKREELPSTPTEFVGILSVERVGIMTQIKDCTDDFVVLEGMLGCTLDMSLESASMAREQHSILGVECHVLVHTRR